MAAPNLTRVSRLGLVNAFLVGEEDGLTLVDTMIPGSTKAILGQAQALGLPIVRIVLTHAHGDHIGSLDKLVASLGPGVEVLISARDAKLLAKDTANEPGEPADAKIPPGGAPGRRRARPGRSPPASASARSRSWRRPATRRGTSRSSTRATGR